MQQSKREQLSALLQRIALFGVIVAGVTVTAFISPAVALLVAGFAWVGYFGYDDP